MPLLLSALELAFRRLCVYARRLRFKLLLWRKGRVVTAPSAKWPELPGVQLGAAVKRNTNRGKRVLIIDSLFPTPSRDSGSVRMLAIVEIILGWGYQIIFVADRGGDTTALRELSDVTTIDGRNPVHACKAICQHLPDIATALVCRQPVAEIFLPLLRKWRPDLRVVFDTVDLHGLREWRMGHALAEPALQIFGLETLRRELELANRCDDVIVVSAAEQHWLSDRLHLASRLVSNIVSAPVSMTEHATRRNLVFIGGFQHHPNVDAVEYFVAKVWPLIHNEYPDMQLHIIGQFPPVAWHAWKDASVLIHGAVDDLMPLLDSALATIAPLRFGAGVKGKINTSLAAGIPVIATSCAAEGMELKDEVSFMLADEPTAFCHAIGRLRHDRLLWEYLRHNGLSHTQELYSPEQAFSPLRQALFGS